MWNRNLYTGIRYFTILIMIVGIVFKNPNINNSMIIFIFIFLINNQIRFFSLDKNYAKIISFIIEIGLTVIAYKWIGGYLITYLILQAMDSNILFKAPFKHIFNIVIVMQSVVLTINESGELRFLNLAVLIIIVAVLYLIKDENDRKLQAQKLYDKLRLSEEKLQNANRDLEIYAASIEELTLLRERNRLSREIHDSVGHALSTIVVQLGAIERTVGKNDELTKEVTKELRKFTQNSLNDVRMAVREIKPKEFEEYEGILVIEELINSFKKLTGVDARLSFTKEKWALNSDQSFVIYRIVQEFLSNSVRHGKASMVKIVMVFSEYKLVVTLKDNGVGVDGLVEGIGLMSMRERVTEIGGTLKYSSKCGDGFLVKIELDKIEKLKIYSQEHIVGEI